MKITHNGKASVLETSNMKVLFSFETPVAADIDGALFRTSMPWSVNTSKHIREWLQDRPVELKPQTFFDDLFDDYVPATGA